MLLVALKGVIARIGRVMLTSLAIIVSTAFLSGTFILRDTIERTFDALFAQVYEQVDVYVQSGNSVETALGFERRDDITIDAVAAVARVDGVVDAQVFVDGDAVVIDKAGDPIQRTTRSTSGATLNTGPMSVWTIISGRAPTGSDEMVLDDETAADGPYVVGDTVKVNAEGGSKTFTLVGIAQYDEIATPGNATWALFDEQTAMDFLVGPGYIDAVIARGDGSVSPEVLAQRVQAALDGQADLGELDVLTGEGIARQEQTEIERGLSFFTIFLSIFSFIAFGVGCFVIYNVFSITAAERQRENALLRAIGASRRQVTSMLLLEALTVGIVGSLLGLAGGVGLAIGIRNLLDALEIGLPARGLAFQSSTVVVTMAAGIITTLLAAIVPALASGRVAPVAAMAETAFERERSNVGRLIVAAICLVIGVGGIILVVNGADAVLLGVAVVAIFVAALMVGPVMANPIARVMGAPIERFRGVTGAMARGNVQRNPRRTARTAAPVLIGVALVTGATVFAASIKTQIRETISSQFLGDYVINSSNGGALSFAQSFVDDLNELPAVGEATGLGFLPMIDLRSGAGAFATTINPATAADLLDYDFLEGSFADLTPDGILISTGEADRKGLQLGSVMPLQVGSKQVALRVEGIYSSSELAQARVVHRDVVEGSGTTAPAAFVFLEAADGVSEREFRAAVDASIETYGIGTLQDREEFIDGRGELVDQTLSFVYGLLALSVIIAIFGIVLTMLLAVYERRRETGLLRAVGMTRSQVRVMVRWESVLTSLYGAVVGVVLGLVLGYVVIVALRDQGLTTYAVPTAAIVSIVVAAFVVGILAAVIPARRATRFDILRAIAADG